MLFVRLIVLATAVALGALVLAWILTGERKWLHHAWLVFKVAVFALVVVLLLFAGEAALQG